MFWLIIAIVVWAIVHSWLASLSFKDFLRRVLGDGFMRLYRLFYNLFAVISFAPVLYLMVTLPDQTLYQARPPWDYLMQAGQGISLLLLMVAVWQTDVLSFVGLRQLWKTRNRGRWSPGGCIVLCGTRFTRSVCSSSGSLQR